MRPRRRPRPRAGSRPSRPRGFAVKHSTRLIAAVSVGVALLVTSLGIAAAQSERINIQAEAIDAFDPRDASRHQFGALHFRGGLVLNSAHRDFGGLSALRVAPDGRRFLALSDRGNWVRAAISYRGDRPVAITDTEIAPVLGPDGRPLNRGRWYDTEALAEADGALYIGIERVHQIVRFDYRAAGLPLPGRGQPIAVPSGFRTLPHNRGIECLAAPGKGMPHAGTLIAISERGLDTTGNIRGFLIGSAGGMFSVKRTDEFDISDCTITPRGDLLLLERRFSWTRGVAMRIRSVALSRLKPGALLDGPELIFADMGYQIDNMEGIAVHRAGNGALVLTLVSDDNFSVLQRTLLLQFTLVGE